MYELTLKIDKDGYVLDLRQVATDEELFGYIGKFGVWYFLALDSVDYKDATSVGRGYGKEDAILAFTCDKANDEPDGPHRHGSPRGVLARGKCWYWDSSKAGSPCSLLISRK